MVFSSYRMELLVGLISTFSYVNNYSLTSKTSLWKQTLKC